MVKRCCWGTCNSDSRYSSRLAGGVTFKPFPKPKTHVERCLLWIKRCGRPGHQLNIDILRDYSRAKHLYVCSKHFKGNEVDPIPALPHDRHTPRRPPPKCRIPLNPIVENEQQKSKVFRVTLDGQHLPVLGNMENKTNDKEVQTCQTTNNFQPDGEVNLETLALAAENRRLQEEYAKLVLQMEDERTKYKNAEKIKKPVVRTLTLALFSVKSMKAEDFQYYTGFSHQRFIDLSKFLIPSADKPFQYSKNMDCLKHISLEDQLLFVLIKLRQNFDFKHLAHLFSISQQDCSVLFHDWINYMFYRLGSLSVWPHRDIIIENMPKEYRRDFPNTVVIIDGTEIKIQKPSALKTQSQCYSDYKSCTTLKALVGVDPRGSVIFSSMLFSGSISDKEICVQSGFYNVLESLLTTGKLKTRDGIMADKGFTIEKELGELNLQLNIPPFAPSSGQMTAGDVSRTIKIAKHRVHVERAIARIKQFKILSNKVSLAFFKSIDQIWLVCSLLTNFMPFLLSRDL